MQRRSLRTTRQKDKYISWLQKSQREKRKTNHVRIMIERILKAQRHKFKKLILNYNYKILYNICFLKKRWWTSWKNEEKKQSMIASKNVEVKKKVIYSSANLIMHCLLQLILTRWRWSDVMMIKSDENERNENLYSTVKYNLTCWERKLLALSLSKMKNEIISNVSDEMLSHHSRSMIHHQLKKARD